MVSCNRPPIVAERASVCSCAAVQLISQAAGAVGSSDVVHGNCSVSHLITFDGIVMCPSRPCDLVMSGLLMWLMGFFLFILFYFFFAARAFMGSAAY